GEYWADGAEGFTVYCLDGIVTRDGTVRPFSEGLAFDSDGHGTASVTGLSSCKDASLVIPSRYNGEAVRTIALSAFEGASLTDVICGIGIEEIEEAAFRGCDALLRVMMPEGMKRIGYGAFFDCGKLTEVLIPRSVTVIDGEAFRGCASLRVIRYGGTTEQWAEIEFGDRWDDETGDYTVYCTNGTVTSSEGGFVITPGELPPSIGPGEYEE
ncbi:MAG: leucine-rich repeat domain-containing protein, partial [Clostridia bacterium]|nr:leucine-rich repeat domain-containing protein [Clostridia bacterium]